MTFTAAQAVYENSTCFSAITPGVSSRSAFVIVPPAPNCLQIRAAPCSSKFLLIGSLPVGAAIQQVRCPTTKPWITPASQLRPATRLTASAAFGRSPRPDIPRKVMHGPHADFTDFPGFHRHLTPVYHTGQENGGQARGTRAKPGFLAAGNVHSRNPNGRHDRARFAAIIA